MPILSIIIPTYNREKILHKTLLAANKAIEDLDAEIIVVNDSKINTPVFSEKFVKTILVNNPLQGPASARNFGEKLASAPNLLFMDDDFIINASCLKEVLKSLGTFPNDCFNFPNQYPPELYNKIKKTQFGRYLIAKGVTATKDTWSAHWKETELFENPGGLGSGFLAIKKQLFKQTGGYDQSCIFAGEDEDLLNKLKQFNARVFINPFCTVYHNEEDKTEIKSWLYRQYIGKKTSLQWQVSIGNNIDWPYSPFKSFILPLLEELENLLLGILKMIPNTKYFDLLYFRIVDTLYIINLYRGFRDILKPHLHE
ncbi:glycosyltransferase family 2 protein [Adhaeribacter aquaticus]|uniref:glycosyltransferase family 2 protein n=1 Tax=Adhaeribacter aquaticus TaxID=299567 RepID=UPI0004269D78|nr:glycosyltransferase family 2 protein [Adhaeribacter aquaticus]